MMESLDIGKLTVNQLVVILTSFVIVSGILTTFCFNALDLKQSLLRKLAISKSRKTLEQAKVENVRLG